MLIPLPPVATSSPCSAAGVELEVLVTFGSVEGWREVAGGKDGQSGAEEALPARGTHQQVVHLHC
jgi:hypothetical protein